MKTRNKIILITAILIVGLVVIPSVISVGSTYYCNSVYPQECVSYSISLIPNFRPIADSILYEEESQRQYDTTPATCNDFMGEPDGDCFVKAFEECKHASIKNKFKTIEGDPVFVYAYIDVDDCMIRYSVDLRMDRFSSDPDQTFHSYLCTSVQPSEYELSFQCGDVQQVLSLR